MRGADRPQTALFSYLSIAERIPADHPLRTVQALYATRGRPSHAFITSHTARKTHRHDPDSRHLLSARRAGAALDAFAPAAYDVLET